MTGIKKNIFKLILTVWFVLWVFFLVREDKDGQYGLLRKLYGSSGMENSTRYIMGGDFYDFLVLCRGAIPEGASYEAMGFEEFSIDKVRARYMLWPRKAGCGRTDFKIFCGDNAGSARGYRVFRDFGKKGRLLISEELVI